MKKLSVLILLGLLWLSLAGVTAISAQSGATLVVVNYVGDELIFTLDGTAYKIPGVNVSPSGGQMSFSLSAGRHVYSGLVPGRVGSNGEIDLAVGQTYVLGARLDTEPAVISPAGVVLRKPYDKVVFFAASLTPAAPTPTPQPPALQPIPAGQGAVVFVNYIGEGLTVNINATLYTVPADGRLQINLAPGDVNYTASAGTSSCNGTVRIEAGVFTGLGFTRDLPVAPEYDVGELKPTAVPLKLHVSPVPLGGEPVATATPVTPPPAAAPSGGAASLPSGGTMLLVVNYVGEMATFTINNQVYTVAGNGGSVAITLAPGDYTFTASTPKASTNGSVKVVAGASVRVSIAANPAGDQLNTYIQ